jgi:membrane protein DedA with SNARE-associated domain
VDALLGDVVNWALSIIQRLGYVGIAGLLVLENLVPPIPSELILPLAGFLAGRGELSLTWAWGAATAGSVLGALVLYGMGREVGEQRLREFVRRWGRWLVLSEDDLCRGQQWFERHGGKTVLICRLVPFLRSVISIPAGLEGMPLWRFVLYTAIGSGLWNAGLIGAGWWLGGQWQQVQQYAKVFGYAGLLGIGAWIAWELWQHKRRRPSRAG